MPSVSEQFRTNARGFWAEYRWWMMVFIFCLGCDAISTTYFMVRDSSWDHEIHLSYRFAAEVFGPVVGPLVGAVCKAVAGIVVGIYMRRYARYIFFTASFLSLWAAWYNVWGYQLAYYPLIFRWIPW